MGNEKKSPRYRYEGLLDKNGWVPHLKRLYRLRWGMQMLGREGKTRG
jgi:hypothetical protein